MKLQIFLLFSVILLTSQKIYSQNATLMKESEFPSFAKKYVKSENGYRYYEGKIRYTIYYLKQSEYDFGGDTNVIAIINPDDNSVYMKLDGKIIKAMTKTNLSKGIQGRLTFTNNEYVLTFDFSIRANPGGIWDGNILITKNGLKKRIFAYTD